MAHLPKVFRYRYFLEVRHEIYGNFLSVFVWHLEDAVSSGVDFQIFASLQRESFFNTRRSKIPIDIWYHKGLRVLV